jgi:hypothetical protein
MNPHEKDCPRCGAAARQKCRNYRGQGKATCKERLADRALDAQAGKRAVRRAERENAKEADALPLLAYAGLVADHTADEMYRRWRRNASQGVERFEYIRGGQLLGDLQCVAIRRYALGVVGAELFAKLDAYCRRTYQSSGYWYGFWRSVLTGERIEFAFERVENRKVGEPAVRCVDWYEARHLSRDNFHARFPFKEEAPAPFDDGGLAAHLDALFARLRDTSPSRTLT